MEKQGTKVALLYYDLKPDKLKLAIKECKKRGIATIGELGYTTYKDAIKSGIQSFIHTPRYTVDILPKKLREEYNASPFGKPREEMYRYYEGLTPEKDSSFMQNAKMMGSSNVALIPTMSIFYPGFSFAMNYWDEPAARIINPGDIHLPVDKKSGKWATSLWSEALTHNLLKIEQNYKINGAVYLAGSGVDAFGTMPGISMHVELEMLTRIGLTNREAIAAATSNYSEIFGWKNIGKIEIGREADILILNENPVTDIGNLKKIDFLFVDGRLIERERLLTDIEIPKKKNYIFVDGRLIEREKASEPSLLERKQ